MALAELLQRRRWQVVVAGGALLGAMVGLFLPIRAADPPSADEAVWSLPNAGALKRFSDSTFQSLKAGKFWGSQEDAGRKASAAQSSWTLTGILTRPTVQVAVGVSGKPAQTWVRVGEKLPDGAVLVAVTRDRIWFVKDDCRRVRSLYQDKTHPDPEGCLDANGKPKVEAGAPSTAPAPAAGRTPVTPTH